MNLRPTESNLCQRKNGKSTATSLIATAFRLVEAGLVNRAASQGRLVGNHRRRTADGYLVAAVFDLAVDLRYRRHTPASVQDANRFAIKASAFVASSSIRSGPAGARPQSLELSARRLAQARIIPEWRASELISLPERVVLYGFTDSA